MTQSSMSQRSSWIVALLTLACVFVVSTQGLAAEEQPVGTVQIDQVQVAFLLSGKLGSGKLHFNGKTHAFKIGGLGVGGIGISSIEAYGQVYDLKKLADFSGVYGEARTGFVLGEGNSGGLWLKNTNGVRLHLEPKRKGVALSLGADGIVITMK